MFELMLAQKSRMCRETGLNISKIDTFSYLDYPRRLATSSDHYSTFKQSPHVPEYGPHRLNKPQTDLVKSVHRLVDSEHAYLRNSPHVPFRLSNSQQCGSLRKCRACEYWLLTMLESFSQGHPYDA